jgi:tRNA threonylcarbamoyladenosine biosynthesis protein TsaE
MQATIGQRNGSAQPAPAGVWEVISHSPEDTWQLAERVVEALPGAAVLALHGDLGSGKTTFVQGIALALGIGHPVTSPTFTIVNEHHGTRTLHHVDLYRLAGPDDVLNLGFDEYLESDGITAVEWPDRAEGLLPAHTVHIRFDVMPCPDERRIRIAWP